MFTFCLETKLILEQVQKVASTFKEEGITFVIANEKDNEQELKDLQLEDSAEDINVAYFASAKKRYAMEPTDEFNAQTLTDFVEFVRTGKVKPVIKSAIPPAVNPVKNLLTLVGDTFEKLVIDSQKDTLVEFYAPWCGHCKSLEKIYRELAENFQVESDRVQIAKIDATANDYPETFAVSGFPTLYYVRASDPLNPVAYEGDRSLESLTKFVHEHLLRSPVTYSKEEL